MIFTETRLKGAFIIEPQRVEDERGFFARSFCKKEFEEHGLNPCIVQCNISYNKNKATLRGMHYQVAPHAEDKVVSCPRGSIYDVIIDLRPDSVTYCEWLAVELSSENYTMLYIPKGYAHGFQTLEYNTAILYQMSEFYHPDSARGVRWDDPAFGIEWPITPPVISHRDRSYEFIKNHINYT